MSFGRARDDNDSEKKGGGLFAPQNNIVGQGGQRVEAFLGKGCRVVGTIVFAGPAEIDGTVEGEVTAQDRLTIGEAAVVTARITGVDVTIKGTVHGDISASTRLALKRPARVVGNIASSTISIEEGVVFEGKCTMGGASVVSVADRAGDKSVPRTISPTKAVASA